MTERVLVVRESDTDKFENELLHYIKYYEEKGYTVEVKYSCSEYYDSALLIVRKEVENDNT